ncbi:bifunctional UDP-N-acetylglucosamine diphosphorylase/glucosamine-1-phosphate N-acetyltransferase GlmU [Roseospirillum parvum]|uniref:Bifunctional protein GlmU n=1 Tax=Roseospirillum parvum TaxID=83401 RepID=A0A1G8CR48_9PROT|nr:bifunctional UDP-N-acetylglucosamine diphosphorylase/glucosamine-1-phosphate N-acetyltransferase GlmU [Roseospirillum parvum]SDH47824.1 bifunctional UDP-N-acetylglucosamine pyrophosphorylase / Glucosamine-1-phosphate N-acetyltransferase [Roseospirillum parvum]
MPTTATPASPTAAIVLAAGLGTRMKSRRPKVMHAVGHRPLVGHVLAALAALPAGQRPDPAVVVIGPDMDELARTVAPHPTVIQAERLGTGHAARQALPALPESPGDVFILFGDTPLIRPQTLSAMLEARRAGPAVVVLGFRPQEPGAYGRLITGSHGLERIVEARDASPEELAVPLCNSGVMCLDGARLAGWLEGLGNDNAKGEYYLTDIVALARAEGLPCAVVEGDEEELLGVNDRADLALAESAFQARARNLALAGGVTLTDPMSVHFSADTRLGQDVTVGPFTVFGPGVTVEAGVTIKGFCHLEGCTVEAGATVGPYARLRPGAEIGPGAHIGNFVEVKKASVEAGAKVNHLTYIGDARVGAGANVGAGTITCNYDGFAKHHTDIGAGAFIGSNSALVAPVKIGDGAMVGAGSTITEDVPADALGLARGRQQVRPGWASRFRAAMRRLRH